MVVGEQAVDGAVAAAAIGAEHGWAVTEPGEVAGGAHLTLAAAVDSHQSIRAALGPLHASHRVDVFVSAGPPVRPQLAVFDMDSTLIRMECIVELAKHAGTGERVSEITEAAMRGELDFAASFRERLATLRGLPASIIDDIAADLPVMPGVGELIASLTGAGCRCIIASGGFTVFARVLMERFGFAAMHSHELEIADGLLTGEHHGEIIDGAAKERILRETAAAHDIPLSACVAVGDGANDLGMMGAAGLGIAYHAKPVVSAAADQAVVVGGHEALLPFFADSL